MKITDIVIILSLITLLIIWIVFRHICIFNNSTWKAGFNNRFANATVDDVKRLLGTIMPGEPGYQGAEVEKTVFSVKESDIPVWGHKTNIR